MTSPRACSMPAPARPIRRATRIVNAIIVRGRDQVMLKVTVAEVQRDVIKQLGINLNGSFGIGSSVVNFNTSNPFSASGQSLSSRPMSPAFVRNVTATSERDGPRRRDPHAGGAEPDRDLGRDRDLSSRAANFRSRTG